VGIPFTRSTSRTGIEASGRRPTGGKVLWTSGREGRLRSELCERSNRFPSPAPHRGRESKPNFHFSSSSLLTPA
jgi:hypothetical protein